MKRLTVLFVLAALIMALFAACTMIESGTSDKEIKVTFTNNSTGDQYIFGDLSGLTSTSDFKSGDAEGTTSPSTTAALGLQGSTASLADQAATQVLKDVATQLKAGSDNKQEQTTTSTTQPASAAVIKPEDVLNESASTNPAIPAGYMVLETVQFTGKQMSYHHDDETESVNQDLFRFSKLASEYPSPLRVLWSDGNYLNVPKSSDMAWSMGPPEARDFRKWKPWPDKPAEAYAARGTHPQWVKLLIKNTE